MADSDQGRDRSSPKEHVKVTRLVEQLNGEKG